MNDFIVPSVLENDFVQLLPLCDKDFENLYQVASDPKIWENHPNRNRYQELVFKNFFLGALESGSAFKIMDKINNNWIGSTRFYNFNKSDKSIWIGYTFYAVDCWGNGFNTMVKKMMLDYAFQYVDKVLFHVGSENFRSQAAMKKLGAEEIRTVEIAYFGELPKMNIEYVIEKSKWLNC